MIKSNQYYMSSSLNSFHLNIIGSGEWVGEESLILPEYPFQYSLIALNPVVAYHILISDFKSKVTKEIQDLFHEMALKKMKFISKRFETICNTSSKISKMNKQASKIDTNYQECSILYKKMSAFSHYQLRKKKLVQKLNYLNFPQFPLKLNNMKNRTIETLIPKTSNTKYLNNLHNSNIVFSYNPMNFKKSNNSINSINPNSLNINIIKPSNISKLSHVSKSSFNIPDINLSNKFKLKNEFNSINTNDKNKISNRESIESVQTIQPNKHKSIEDILISIIYKKNSCILNQNFTKMNNLYSTFT